MNKQYINNILLWAEPLANTYDIGINIIINNFLSVKAQVGDIKEAKNVIESQLMEKKGSYLDDI